MGFFVRMGRSITGADKERVGQAGIFSMLNYIFTRQVRVLFKLSPNKSIKRHDQTNAAERAVLLHKN